MRIPSRSTCIAVLISSALAVTASADAPGVGTPEAYLGEFPPLPTTVAEARKKCPALPGMQEALDAKGQVKPATPTKAQQAQPGRDEGKFLQVFAELGKDQGKAIYQYNVDATKANATMVECTNKVSNSGVSDRVPGNNQCYQAFLASLGPSWKTMVTAAHDLVVLKADFIAKTLKTAKDPAFQYRLTFVYRQGLWIHASNVLQLWGTASCSADQN